MALAALVSLLFCGASSSVEARPPARGGSLNDLDGEMSGVRSDDGSEARTKVRFRVPLPNHPSGIVQLSAAQRIARRAAKRLAVRYNVAGVTSASVEVKQGAQIEVTAAPGTDPGWLHQIAIPHGRFLFGPVVAVGSHWTDVSRRLPSGVEIRQAEGSLRAEDAYLWSDDRARLEGFIENESPMVGTAYAYPTAEGWRTLTLGDPILNHDQVEEATIKHAPTGAPFVQVTLDAKGAQAVGVHSGTDGEWMAVLDGEAVATLSRLGVHGEKKLPLRPPDHLTSDQAKQWAKLVAARLSAHIPIGLIPVDGE